MSVTRRLFDSWLSDALRHLYDTPALKSNPLGDILLAGERDLVDRCQNLRRVLVEAIHAVHPATRIPEESTDWRLYRILELRYIDGLNPDAAMEHLALQKSQYFQDQARAVELVGDFLWARYYQPQELSSEPDWSASSADQLTQLEVERLCRHATWSQLDLGVSLQELQNVVNSLADSRRLSVEMDIRCHPKVQQGSRVLLRQATLNAVSCALDLSSGETLRLSCFEQGNRKGIQVRVHLFPAASVPDKGEQDTRLEIAGQLMRYMGGALRAIRCGSEWVAELAWREGGHPSILIIDDNRGLADLFRRYLVGHDWQVQAAINGSTARQAIADSRPEVIFLDVLMPEEDGWELLTALKRGEHTRDIPVVVCSVLTEPDLAESLGADAYLPKPVSEQSLLRVLQRWAPQRTTLLPKP